EPLEGASPVPVLAAFLACHHADAGRQVNESHRRFRPVLVLAAGSAGRERLDAALGQEGVVSLGDRYGVSWLVAHGVSPEGDAGPVWNSAWLLGTVPARLPQAAGPP